MGDVSSWLSGCASTKTRARFLSSVSWRRWRCFGFFFILIWEISEMALPSGSNESATRTHAIDFHQEMRGKVAAEVNLEINSVEHIFFLLAVLSAEHVLWLLFCFGLWVSLVEFVLSFILSIIINSGLSFAGSSGGWSRPNDSPDVGCIRQARLHMWLWHRNWPMLSLTFC